MYVSGKLTQEDCDLFNRYMRGEITYLECFGQERPEENLKEAQARASAAEREVINLKTRLGVLNEHINHIE